MTKTRLKKLVLTGNNVKDRGCEAITLALQTNQVLVGCSWRA
jgi:hypothetical protein